MAGTDFTKFGSDEDLDLEPVDKNLAETLKKEADEILQLREELSCVGQPQKTDNYCIFCGEKIVESFRLETKKHEHLELMVFGGEYKFDGFVTPGSVQAQIDQARSEFVHDQYYCSNPSCCIAYGKLPQR